MKRYIFITLFLCGLLAFSSPGWSLTLGDVRLVDTLYAETALGNSGEQEETDWINSILSTTYVKEDLVKDESPSWSELTDDPNTWAYDLGGTPGYFLIKTGNISGITSDTFLYTNSALLQYAVLDFDLYPFIDADIEKISHVSYAGGSVSEPATMLLLGAGLLGLAGLGRKKLFK